jgi:hypothetical protein
MNGKVENQFISFHKNNGDFVGSQMRAAPRIQAQTTRTTLVVEGR